GAGEAAPTPEQAAAHAREVLRLSDRGVVAKGITTFQYGGAPFAAIDSMKAAIDREDLHVRLWVMVRGSSTELAANLDKYKVVGYGGGMLTVRAIKEFAERAVGSRGGSTL